METNVNNDKKTAANRMTEQELKQQYPKLWKAAMEKLEQVEITWTPEFRAALRKLREQRSRPLP